MSIIMVIIIIMLLIIMMIDMMIDMITDAELSEVVAGLRRLGGDIEGVEAKRARDELPRSVRETLSAFSNSLGGVLILGLDERSGFAATGVADAVKMASDLGSMCSDQMEPPVRPLIDVKQFESVDLVVAEIPAVDYPQRPCYYKGAGMSQGSFIRVHDGDRRLTSYEVQLMLANRGQPRDDEEPVPGTGVGDLDLELVQSYTSRLRETRARLFGSSSDPEILTRSGVLDSSGACTLGGLLALGTYPQSVYPQLMLTFVHYPSPAGGQAESGERFLDNVAFDGPIPLMVRDAMAVLRRNMARRSSVLGPSRTDRWEYPETALREAIVNALVHRDLSRTSRGSQVQIEMYPDRLVVRNPGGLFGPITTETLLDGSVSSARNARLLRILEDVPIPMSTGTVCENRGSGVREMVNSLRAAGMSLPKFEDRISSFTVTFPSHALLSDDVVDWIKSLNEVGLTDSQCVGLAMMRDGTLLDNPTYRSATGIDSRLATSELQDLVARELVLQEGDRRWARYRLASPGATGSTPVRRLPGDRRQQLLEALGNDTCSRAQLAERTGLSDQVVRHWLRKLREDGFIRSATPGISIQSKNTRYVRVPDPVSPLQDALDIGGPALRTQPRR